MGSPPSMDNVWLTTHDAGEHDAPLSMFALNNDDFSPPGRPLGVAVDALGGRPCASMSFGEFLCSASESYLESNGAPAFDPIPSRETFSVVNHPASRRLKHPTGQDWESLRSEIVRQYKHKAASEIVKCLRHRGYNVTYAPNCSDFGNLHTICNRLTSSSIKMLRDRFRDWGANTKQRPSRNLDTPPTDIPRERALKQVERLLDDLWNRNRVLEVEASRPDSVILHRFVSLARRAIYHDKARAWRCMHRLADRIYECDWSSICPFGLFRLVKETVRITQGDELSCLIDWWTTMVTNRLCRNHPVRLLLHSIRFHADKLGVVFWHAFGSMYDYKIRIYEESEGQDSCVAQVKLKLAEVFIYLGQEPQADEVLLQYAILAAENRAVRLHEAELCDIYYTLGQSSYYQGSHEQAIQYFKRAWDFSHDATILWNIANSHFIASSLVRLGQLHQVEEVLSRLVIYLHENACGLDPDDEPLSVNANYRLNELCDGFARFPELRTVIEQLRNVQVIKQYEDEPTQGITRFERCYSLIDIAG